MNEFDTCRLKSENIQGDTAVVAAFLFVLLDLSKRPWPRLCRKPNLSHALACAEPIFSYTTVSEKELSNVKSTYTWFYSYAVYLKEIASFATIQYNSMLRRKYLREVLLIDKSSTFGEQSMTKHHLLSDK